MQHSGTLLDKRDSLIYTPHSTIELMDAYWYAVSVLCDMLQCFDVTRKITYKNLAKWHKELSTQRPNIPIICIGNKIDRMSFHHDDVML